MNRIGLFEIALMLLFTPLFGLALAQDVKWHDPSEFEVEGHGWFETTGSFARLPDSAQSKVSEVAWQMSRSSAGIAIRFVTDSSTVSTSWTLTSTMLAMPHMPATAVSGLDLYARAADGKWKFIGNGRPSPEQSKATFKFPEGFTNPRECLLYLPLYNGVRELQIGVPEGAVIEPPSLRPADLRKPIVVYGTSIAQGGCASRPGLAWPAILGRILDRPVINLGFSGSGKMEPPIGEVFAELDPAVYIVDCLWNIPDLPQEEFDARVGGLVNAIRENRPRTPIIFVGQSLIHPEGHPSGISVKQETSVRALQENGDNNLHLVAATDLIGDDTEGTVDGVHLNDIGMERQAKFLAPILREMLNEERSRTERW